MFKSFLNFVTVGLGVAFSTALAVPVAELETRQTCADVMVVYARGTFEEAPIGDSTSVTAQYICLPFQALTH